MSKRILGVYCLFLAGICSCGSTNKDKILDWQENIKEEVLEHNESTIDSTWEDIDLNEGARIELKYSKGSLVERVIKNTAGVTLYTAQYAEDTNFALVHEYCTHGNVTYEGIEYKHKPYGLATWYYCESGKVMEQGMRYKFRKAGIWKKYNTDGSLQSETQHEEKIKVRTLPKFNT
ncbi:MAG: hypothetical protein KDC07_04475 [Chitinophagaceae bacterium]|nr:hypothetical protein [Chitinophagaceae bacterium]